MVDIKAERKFSDIVTMEELRTQPELAEMTVLKRGNRFSITPVTQEEFDTVLRLGDAR